MEVFKQAAVIGAVITYFSDWAIQELSNEGFPKWMIYAFIATAQETNSIILSRTPGGDGLDLINAGYDLKGFQIKAKSCNWGPMAGFICQLPFFNKKGYKNISYNAGYIAKYLGALDAFKNNKQTINTINENSVEALNFLNAMASLNLLKVDAITTNFKVGDKGEANSSINEIISSNDTDSGKKAKIENIITKQFDSQIVDVIKNYQAYEQTSGKWSGENSIDGNDPFIALKREFDTDINKVMASVKKMRGVDVDSVIIINNEGGQLIYGTAQDDSQTVWMEFILKQEGNTNVWAIYHGRINYKKAGDKFKEFESYADLIISYADLERELSDIDNKILQKIFPSSTPASFKETIKETANFPGGAQGFYPVMGFVNPHPPYKRDGDLFYKNAVSGDYDLFAFWPKEDIPYDKLIRYSERYLKTGLKLSAGNLFRLYIEFIPGFTELNPDKALPGDVLKESAELGNISSLGFLVAGMLNSFSNIYFKPVLKASGKNTVAANKAFHSDEGGRPGVMEIEFPVAVFFDQPVKTKALSNKYYYSDSDKEKKNPLVPALNDTTKRIEIETYGGLIKTPEELLEIILLNFREGSLLKNDYYIVMQAEWMAHLFFISLDDNKRKIFLNMGEDYSDDLGNLFGEDYLNGFNQFYYYDENGNELTPGSDPFTKRQKSIDKKLDEFQSIQKNHNSIYSNGNAFDQPTFETNLKILFGLSSPGDNEKFNNLRVAFLKMAFNTNRRAAERMHDIGEILYDIPPCAPDQQNNTATATT